MRSTVPRLSKSALQLYLVFGPQDLPTGQTAIGLIEQAAAGGVTCLQWRDKTARADTSPGTETDTGIQQRVAHVRPLQDCARALGVPFLINDDVALAKALGADGVHLGQDDMPPSAGAARRLGAKTRSSAGPLGRWQRTGERLRRRAAGADATVHGLHRGGAGLSPRAPKRTLARRLGRSRDQTPYSRG